MGKEYIYRTNKILLLFAVAVFSGFALVTINEAFTLDKGVRIMRVITLDVQNAKYLFWALTALFIYPVIIGLLSFARSFGKKRYIHLSGTHLRAPKNPYSGKVCNVLLIDVVSINSTFAGKTEILNILHKDGKLVVSEGVFENEFKFNSFKYDLNQYLSVVKNA